MPAAQIALALGKEYLKKKAIDKGIERFNNSSPETQALAIAFPVIVLGLPIIVVLMAMLLITSITSSYHSDVDKLGGAPTSYGSKITGVYLSVFQQAQTRYNVSWAVLAAIAETESSMGKYPVGIVSPAGAVGFMQFMPATWSGYTNPKAVKNKSTIITALAPYDADNLPPPNIGGLPYDTDPDSIALYNGYGTDGDGDGYADPYNPVDAIFSAAKMIKANMTEEGNYENPLFLYNHNRNYVMQVLNLASSLTEYQLPSSDGMWPTDSQYPVTTKYNQAGKLWASGYHTGMDIACPIGTPIYAVFDGQIRYAGSAAGYGGLICLTDNRGTVIKYGHLSGLGVKYGETVTKGQVIGRTGNTGNSTGPHLHFEVQVNGQLCDPLTWIKAPGEPGKENY